MADHIVDRAMRFRSRAAGAKQEPAASDPPYRLLWEAMSDVVILLDEQGRILSANPAIRDIFGYDSAELIGEPVTRLQPDALHASHAQQFVRHLACGIGQIDWRGYESIGLHRDGREFPVEIIFTDMLVESRRQLACFIRDITLRKNAEQAVAESEQRFRQLAENIPQAVFLIEPGSSRVLYASPVFEAIWGQTREALYADSGVLVRALHPGEHELAFSSSRELSAVAESDESFRIVRPDGSVRWIRARSFPIRDGEGAPYRIATLADDITANVEAKERLLHLAHYDALTDLPNRTLVYERLKEAVHAANTCACATTLLIVDLDGFKNVNDSLGHACGDDLLREVGRRLRACVRPGDTIGRLGGDEFAAILINSKENPRAAVVVANRIRAAISLPFSLDEHEARIAASIGIAQCPGDSANADALLKCADTAMYAAKDAGRDTYCFYTEEMHARVLRRRMMETSLRQAIDEHEFVLHHQPKQCIEDGSWSGMEALLRWARPGHALVSPAAFIPILEETGLIVPAGKWVIHAACRQIADWQRRGLGPIRIAVNVSGKQFMQVGLAAEIARAIEESAIRADLLEIEITESTLMSGVSETNLILRELKTLGIRVAIDDFGTGYCSLAYLKRFPIDTLKIDSAFIRDLTIDSDDAAITAAIINMAHSLKLRVVAEGVETIEQIDFLRDHHCDEIQGYYVSRPVPAADMEVLVRAHAAARLH
jgi:diguanylate cyclase (GGDEF)-like protein/PAS domain S-box-containing protein